MDRPKCSRCNAPLDAFYDPATGRVEWCCNAIKGVPSRNEGEHEAFMDNLPGDEVAHLEKTK